MIILFSFGLIGSRVRIFFKGVNLLLLFRVFIFKIKLMYVLYVFLSFDEVSY